VRVLSADWVVPMDGDPIPAGAVAIGDDGRIAGVGTIADLGEGDHFPEAVILPGFVNAHSHLEYAVYAGFGDGLSFGPWIALHVERKQRLDLEGMEAIARQGALDCLRSGITTVGDCSFSGAAATACAELGLRAIVYLEVFGADATSLAERFEPMRERISDALSDRVQLGISPHAPYTCSVDLYRASSALGLPLATHLAESEAETEFLQTGSGSWQAFAEMLVPPPGRTGIRALADAGLLGPHVVAAHCVQAGED
jgi:5-methylthioadenosine/S-adenosylhomocysteine deaminase